MNKIALLIILTGCMVGPNYQKPEEKMAEQFIGGKRNESDIKEFWNNFHDETLTKLVGEAIQNNRDIKIAYQKIEKTRALYNLARARLFPEVDAEASVTRARYSQNGYFQPQNPIYTDYQVGFDAIWEIDLFGKLRREKEAAFYTVQSYEERLQDVSLTMISDVALVYDSIRTAEKKISLLKQKITVEKRLLKLSKDRFLSGIVEEDEEQNILYELKIVEEDLINEKTFLKENLHLLAVLVGRAPEEFSLEEGKILKSRSRVEPGLPSRLLERRPDIRAAERTLAAKTAEIGAAVASFFPSFSLTAALGLDSLKTNNLFNKRSSTWSIAPGLSWPVLDFGRIASRVDFTKAEEKEAFLSYEQTILNALKEVENSLSSYAGSEVDLIKKREEFLAIKRINLLSKDRQKSGLENELDFLLNKERLIDTRIGLYEAEEGLTISTIALYKALGGGF